MTTPEVTTVEEVVITIPKKKALHYVNNKQFSLAVVEYVKLVRQAQKDELEIPIVPNYIAECFLKISEGLSHKSNFIRYTYREEMVMDAVENCLKAILNYDIDYATRTGTPNAFSYFTQICYFAFLRRLSKEKRQQDIKFRYIEQAGMEDFMQYDEDNSGEINQNRNFVDSLRDRIGRVREHDKALKDFATIENIKVKGVGKKKKKKLDENGKEIRNGIELFMG